MNAKRVLLISIVVLVALIVTTSLTVAQGPSPSGPRAPQALAGTAFTYQGHLKKDGAPVTASCFMLFRLWDAEVNGNVVHSWVSGQPSPVAVSAGLFTAAIDFGANVFTGEARWLETSIRCLPDSTYTTFIVRQPLTPAPMALALPGLYTQPNLSSPNVIGGYSGNVISATVFAGTIGGGGSSIGPNRVWQIYGTVGGGYDNTASGYGASVSGGYHNIAKGDQAAVGGGDSNTASGTASTIPGGRQNTAVGVYSFAAGHQAKANHDGSFVWGDSTSADFASTGIDQFLIRASNGVGINSPGPFTAALSVNGQIVAGGITVPSGSSEPFVATGSNAGISLDDRANGSASRWVIYANDHDLNFWTNGFSNMILGSNGTLRLDSLAVGGTTSLCWNLSHQIATCSSSLRYKSQVAPLSLGLATVAQLHPVTFDWKDSGAPDLGFVAEEVDQVSPLLTTRNAQGQIEGVKYDRLTAVLVNAVQEQQQQITDLQKEKAEQKQEIAQLKESVAQTQARLDALEQTIRANGAPARGQTQDQPIPWVLVGGMAMGAGIALGHRRREGAVP